MGPSALLRLGASIIVALALCGALRAQEDDDDYPNGNGDRRSTWEPSTSLVFQRYFEPFPRVSSPRACRDKCMSDRRCTGWTYYDANFREAGDQSYRLQRICVLGAGLRDRKSGNRPGRTSGVVRGQGQEEDYGPPGNNGNNSDYRPPRRGDYRSRNGDD
jgi:PAN domain-containing protein